MLLGDHLFALWQCRRRHRLTTEQSQAQRWAAFRRLLDYAYRHVPAYRRMLERQGVRPAHIRGPGDLCRLPLLTRETLISQGSTAFLAEHIRPETCLAKRSSGSSGEPLTVFCTPLEDFLGNASFLSAYIEGGLRPWHKLAFLFNPKSRANIRLAGLMGSLMRRYLYLSPERDWGTATEQLRRFDPDVIIGYNQTLLLLARELARRGVRLRPRLLFGYAEMLEPAARAEIKLALGAELLDVYAATETDCIAWECAAHQGYHLNSSNLLIELIKDGRPAAPGSAGRIVVTPLHRLAMPLLRYDLGDIGVLSTSACGCGRSPALLRSLLGRADDFVVLPSGKHIPPVGTFGTIIERVPEVRHYRVEQIDRRRIVVELVAPRGVPQETRARIRAAIERLVEHELSVEVSAVDHINQGSRLKRRRISSRVHRT